MMIKPYITEKSIGQAKNGVFTFVADRAANKITISRLLEKLHSVSVIDVTSSVLKPRSRQFRGYAGKEKTIKKMMVTIKAGQKIPGFEVVEDKKEAASAKATASQGDKS